MASDVQAPPYPVQKEAPKSGPGVAAPPRPGASGLARVWQGEVAPGFGPVADAFARNFDARGEVGAALSVYHRGEKVVDLWGGVRDSTTGDPWRADTMLVVFSTTKGLAATVCARAVSRGLFAYDDPVARYWPEFAAAGKADITVGDLLSHRAGLSHLDTRLDIADLHDPERLSGILARQRPLWQPGRRWGYHALTFGLYLAELIRRTDPQGRTLGRVFAEDIAGPLNIDAYIGLPAEIPDDRIARLDRPGRAQVVWGAGRLPRRLIPKVLNPFSRLHRSLRIIRGFNPNNRACLEPELASATGVAEVRGLARLYGALAQGGRELGITPEVFAALAAMPDLPPGGSRDHVMGVEARWGPGFAKSSPDFPFGSGTLAFGMPGIGGSFAFADPDLELGYAYAPMRLGIVPFDEPREVALRAAVYDCLS